MPLIYFVEDDQAIQYIIDKTILNMGYLKQAFSTGKKFIEQMKIQKPDMILLDVMLPDMSGLDLLKWIRKIDQVIPVMMVSALQSEMDKVVALDLGADDYMVKPFGVLELTSRIQARLRLHKEMDIYQYKNTFIDDKKHICQISGQTIYLTNKEYEIFKLLIKHQNEVVLKEDIFKSVWKTDFIGESRTLDMHIKSLREKLKSNQADFSIQTVRGLGYQVI